MSLSRTAIELKLERWEISELIERLRDMQYRAADKQEYGDAANYKQRANELEQLLKTTPLEPAV